MTVGSVLEVTDATFEKEVKTSDLPVLVDFWAPWCGPCRQLAPVIEQLANENAGSFKVVKIDIDNSPKVASSFAISSIPTLVIFKGGEEVGRMVGAQPKPRLQDAMDRFKPMA
jgi:thioredoxin 1